jgi:UrcA family protein
MRLQKLEYRAYVLALTAVSGLPPAFAAAAPPETRAETAAAGVSPADLNLATPAGLREARQRLAIRSQALCRKFMDDRKISSWETYADCSRDTLAAALQRLNDAARVARR